MVGSHQHVSAVVMTKLFARCCGAFKPKHVSVQGFVNEYPDVKIEQLVNVLLTRGDVSRGEARQV